MHSWLCEIRKKYWLAFDISSSSSICIPTTSSDLHSYARPPPPPLHGSTSLSHAGHGRERRHSRVQPIPSGIITQFCFGWIADEASSLCFHRLAVSVALQYPPDLPCLMMMTWAGASPAHPQPGTASSKVENTVTVKSTSKLKNLMNFRKMVLFSISRNSCAFPQWLECGVAGRWGLGVQWGRLSWWAEVHISEGKQSADCQTLDLFM